MTRYIDYNIHFTVIITVIVQSSVCLVDTASGRYHSRLIQFNFVSHPGGNQKQTSHSLFFVFNILFSMIVISIARCCKQTSGRFLVLNIINEFCSSTG